MMGYQENGDEVTLTMTRQDYMDLTLALGIATGWAMKEGKDITSLLELINRIHQGNPNWTPYETGERDEKHSVDSQILP